MNSEEMQALDRVIDHYIHDECNHAQGSGDTSSGHIAHSLMTLDKLRQRLTSKTNDGTEDQTAGSPIGIVRDHPSHDEVSRGESVIDRGSKEIEKRWAKEAIGLTVVELNEAYEQFEITRDGSTIPTPHLHRAMARMMEVMKRLGLAEYREIDSPIPF